MAGVMRESLNNTLVSDYYILQVYFAKETYLRNCRCLRKLVDFASFYGGLCNYFIIRISFDYVNENCR